MHIIEPCSERCSSGQRRNRHSFITKLANDMVSDISIFLAVRIIGNLERITCQGCLGSNYFYIMHKAKSMGMFIVVAQQFSDFANFSTVSPIKTGLRPRQANEGERLTETWDLKDGGKFLPLKQQQGKLNQSSQLMSLQKRLGNCKINSIRKKLKMKRTGKTKCWETQMNCEW